MNLLFKKKSRPHLKKEKETHRRICTHCGEEKRWIPLKRVDYNAYKDASGRQWQGARCPDCVLTYYQERRQRKKMPN